MNNHMKTGPDPKAIGMNALAFDTSSPLLSVAAIRKDGLLAEASLLGPLQHSENLLRMTDRLLGELGLDFSELDALGTGIGPGSFTGLRIGFSCLKGLGMAFSKPVYGISSLDLIASGISMPEGRLGVIVNARRERIYAAFYRFSGGEWERERDEDEVLSFEELCARGQGKIAFSGDAIQEYGVLLKRKNPEAQFLGENFWYPRVFPLVQMIARRCMKLKTLNLKNMKPQYLRLSEAEEKARHARPYV